MGILNYLKNKLKKKKQNKVEPEIPKKEDIPESIPVSNEPEKEISDDNINKLRETTNTTSINDLVNKNE